MTNLAILIFSAIIAIGMIVLMGIVWWNIFKKAGYPGWRGLLMFIPFVNFIILLIFAFGTWPIHKSRENAPQIQ